MLGAYLIPSASYRLLEGTTAGLGSYFIVEKSPMRSIWLAALVAAMAGCSPLAQRQAGAARFVGQPETVLTRARGVPDSIQVSAGLRLLTYRDWQAETVPGAPFCFGPGPFCGGGGFPPPPPTELACDTTFSVGGGTVLGFSLRGPGCAWYRA
jgi:hypothetical protein